MRRAEYDLRSAIWDGGGSAGFIYVTYMMLVMISIRNAFVSSRGLQHCNATWRQRYGHDHTTEITVSSSSSSSSCSSTRTRNH